MWQQDKTRRVHALTIAGAQTAWYSKAQTGFLIQKCIFQKKLQALTVLDERIAYT